MNKEDYLALIDRYNPVEMNGLYHGYARHHYAQGFMDRKITSVSQVIIQLCRDRYHGVHFYGLSTDSAHQPDTHGKKLWIAIVLFAGVYFLGTWLRIF